MHCATLNQWFKSQAEQKYAKEREEMQQELNKANHGPAALFVVLFFCVFGPVRYVGLALKRV